MDIFFGQLFKIQGTFLPTNVQKSKKMITILLASKKMSILSGEFEIEQGLNLKLEQGRQT